MSTLQDLRYKLQKRVQRIRSVDANTLNLELVRFFDYFDSNLTLRAVAAELNAQFPSIGEEFDTAFRTNNIIEGLTEAENAALGMLVLRKVAAPSDPHISFMRYVETCSTLEETLDRFRERFLDPFYEYIDEHIEDRNIVLAELVRFKHLAEWFRRGRLWDRWNNDSRTREKGLALALYEFLYEQGIDFYIEPASASGEADMVSAQHSQSPLVADVKVFDPASGHGSSYIKRGFHQIFNYLHDFNQPIGYLVVFKGTDKQLEVTTTSSTADIVPSITLGDKTIFFLQVDIFPHEASASRRPIPEREVISEEELRAELSALSSPGDAPS
jgi:hypothetical protein